MMRFLCALLFLIGLGVAVDAQVVFPGSGSGGSVSPSQVTSALNVLDLVANYNAKCDGVTDDTTAIQNWLNAAAQNSRLTAPAGTCLFSSPLTVSNKSYLTIAGAGQAATVFEYTGANTGVDLLTIGSAGKSEAYVQLQDFRLMSTTVMTGGYALHAHGMVDSTVYNVWADSSGGTPSGHGDLCGGLWFDAVADVHMYNYYGYSLQNCGDGILVNGSPSLSADLYIQTATIGGKTTSGAATGFVNGIHMAGGMGGTDCNNCNIHNNLVNFLVDEAVFPVNNREFHLSGTSAIDTAQNAGVLLNDPTAGGGGAYLHNWIASQTQGHGVVVNAWKNGIVDLTGDALYNNCGSGLYIQDSTAHAYLSAAVDMHNNGNQSSTACTNWQTANGGAPALGSGHGYGIEGASSTYASGTASASNGGNILTFSTAPQTFAGGLVQDATNSSYIPAGCTEMATDATHIVLGCTTTHAIAGDTINLVNAVTNWNVVSSGVNAAATAGTGTLAFGASVTGTISNGSGGSGNEMTVSAIASGYLCVGDAVTGTSVTASTTITALISGATAGCSNSTTTGGQFYTVSQNSNVASETLTTALAAAPKIGTLVNDGSNPSALPVGGATVCGSPSTTSVPVCSTSGGATPIQNLGVAAGDFIIFTSAALPTTNSTTANGNATLHFPSGINGILVNGMTIQDLTAPTAIAANTVVASSTGTTVVMSANAAGSGVGNGDVIAFTATTYPRVASRATGFTDPSGLYSANTELGPIVVALASSPFIWVVPDSEQATEFYAIGPGGAGGSGAVQSGTTTACSGGGGGAGGGVEYEVMQPGELTTESALSVTVGPAAVGGTSVSNTASTTGNPGTDSTANTTISNLTSGGTVATGFKGGSGAAGQTAGVTSGGGGSGSPIAAGGDGGSNSAGGGGAGGGANGGNGGNGTAPNLTGAGSGGGGGVITGTNGNGGANAWGPTGGGAGGGDTTAGAAITGGSGGQATRIAAATAGNAGSSLTCASSASVFGLNRCFGTGAGGGTGATGSGVTASSGKTGGSPGGGGSGGGCAQISAGTGVSGAGGNGGAGGAIIIPHQAL